MVRLQQNNKEAEKHFLIVKKLLQNRINSLLRIGYVIKGGNRLNLSVLMRNYLSDLLIDDSLKLLITASPERFQGIIASQRITYPSFFVPGSDDNYILRNIFITHCYDSKDFDKLSFIMAIAIDTCPYCNRSYTYYLSKNSQLKPQIDHFYPKDKYPFLAISFYNLIPSCQTCNGFGAKEDKDPDIVGLINPYLLNADNFKFTYKILSINFLNPLIDKKSIQVKFINQISGHLNVFKLIELYEQHSDHVIELIVKSKVQYSKEYRKYLNSYTGLKFSESEIDRMILGTYSNEVDIHKRPLAKLYQDIGKQLGLIT
jgi:hypothetical protein